jgi:hypothetical protein
MKWTYSIQQKTTAAVLLAAVFAAVFIINRIENKKVVELGKSMNTVYEDRLMAETYIFKLSVLLYEKKIMLDQCDHFTANTNEYLYITSRNESIDRIIKSYAATHLTETEQRLFDQLQLQIDNLRLQEEQLMTALESKNPETLAMMNVNFQSASYLLNELSNLQASIGQSVNERSKQLVAGSSLTTSFELGLLVVIGLLIQALLFSSRSAMKTVCKSPNLN